MISNLKLNETDIQKWKRNLLLFLAPVAVIYLTSLEVTIQQNHGITLASFLPNQFASGGIVLYFINAALDYLKKATSN